MADMSPFWVFTILNSVWKGYKYSTRIYDISKNSEKWVESEYGIIESLGIMPGTWFGKRADVKISNIFFHNILYTVRFIKIRRIQWYHFHYISHVGKRLQGKILFWNFGTILMMLYLPSHSVQLNSLKFWFQWYLGKCTGSMYPYGSRVRVLTGTGTGNNSHTRDLQNEPKNIFFEPELNELWPISWNSSKLAVTHSFLNCFWLFSDSFWRVNPCGSQVQVLAGMGMGMRRNTQGLPMQLFYVNLSQTHGEMNILHVFLNRKTAALFLTQWVLLLKMWS